MKQKNDLEDLHQFHYGKPIGDTVANYPADTIKIKTAYLIIDKFIELFQPQTCLDIGCGTGIYVDQFNKKGIPTLGIEGNVAVKNILKTDLNNILFKDLRSLLNLDDIYDLVYSIECIEHIDEDYVEVLIQNLTSFSNKWLVVTTGIDSKGKNPEHLNEQDVQYWISKIEACGFKYRSDISHELMKYFNAKLSFGILKREKGLEWFSTCLAVFKKI